MVIGSVPFLLELRAPFIIAEMQNTRQEILSTNEYGRNIETLMANLTIAQTGKTEGTQIC